MCEDEQENFKASYWLFAIIVIGVLLVCFDLLLSR